MEEAAHKLGGKVIFLFNRGVYQNHEEEPVAIFNPAFNPKENIITINQINKEMKGVNDMSIDELYELIGEKEQMATSNKGEIESLKRQLQMSILNLQYIEKDLQVLTDSKKVVDFVSKTYKSKKAHWPSQKSLKEKFTFKITGDDVEGYILKSTKDVLILVYSPDSFKNRGLKEKMEAYCKLNKLDHLKIARYNAVNQSKYFETPKKVPAILYFKDMGKTREDREDKLRRKKIIQFKSIHQNMQESRKEQDFIDDLDKFVKQNYSYNN